jgi:cephalosporin hydroxylase
MADRGSQSVVKETAKTLLPDAALRRIQHALAARARRREHRTKPIDLSRTELIREAPLSQLSDPLYLEVDLLPRLGLNDENLHEIPPSLHPHTGYGLLHWQLPNQFSKYLLELSRHEIETYLEIGSRHGGTFVITVEYLSRFHPVREAVAVDLGRSRSLEKYASSREGITVLQADSHSREFENFVRKRSPFDLILIDGDHSEDGCRRDFELVLDHGRILVFHDIVSHPVPGVGKVWREVKEAYADRFRFLEFTDQYPEVRDEAGRKWFGIGVAISRSR